MSFINDFVTFVENLLPKELAVLFLSMVPFIELKGAIHIGISLGLKSYSALYFVYLGSILPCAIIIFLVNALLRKIKEVGKFESQIQRLERRLLRKGENVEKLGLIGLLIFVLISLPGTGVWSGSLLAGLFKLDNKLSMLVIMLGNLIADITVTLLTMGVIHIF
jgi:small multidrug export protein